MAKVGFVKGADEKYKLLTNGIRGIVDNFLKELSEEKISSDGLKILFERKEYDLRIFYKDLEKMNVLLTNQNGKGWIILDFLTPQEFSNIKKSS